MMGGTPGSTNGDQMVGVKALQVRSHLSNPCLDVLVATQSITARLVDEVPGDNHRIFPVDLHKEHAMASGNTVHI